MQRLPTYKKSIIFIALLLTLIFVTPVLADYLGPDRVVTTTVSVCHVNLYSCKDVDGKYKDKKVEDWRCSNESKPWQAYPSHATCHSSGDVGNKHWEREERAETITTTYPSATIAGTVNCTVQNGWCNGSSVPELALSASEPVSGYAITLIEGTQNGESFACQNGETNCNIPMLEGDNAFDFWALSSWGDSSLLVKQTVRVDTRPPEVGLSITGTSGHNDWYKSMVDVSATASDATSGVATFEVAVNDGGYQAYTLVIFDDGQHTLQFRVVDQAGNVFESPVQKFNVDTIPPTVDLPSAWRLGKDVDYSVRDEGSGLASVRIVIEDEDEKYAKVTWDRDASGQSYTSHVDWNGEFRDKTVAPPGTYQLWVKAKDVAGNERFVMGKIIVPEPNMPLVTLPTVDPLATEAALLPPAELVDVEDIPVTAGQSAVEGVASQSGQTTTQTILLTTGSAGAVASTTASGVLWGAAAAAAISAATAYAVETTRKRKEAEEAQAAAVRAEVAEDKARRAEHGMTKQEKQDAKAQQSAVHDAKVQERKEQQSWANPAKEKAQLKVQDEAYQAWVQEQAAAQAALEQKKQEEAAKERMEKKWEKQEALAETKWIAAQERKEKAQQDAQENAAAKRAEEKAEKAELVHENVTSRRTVDEPAEPSNWWEKTKAFVKNNVIDPVNEKVVQPYVKPAIETTKKTVQVVNEKIIQPYVVPYIEQRIDDAKKVAAWTNEKVIQPYVVPYVEQRIDGVKKVAAWTNENIVQPYIQPYVEKRIDGIKQDIAWMNENVIQPYVQPYVEKRIDGIKQDIAWINENIIQPYIAPAVSLVNEKVIQPYIKPYIETQIDAAKDVIEFVDDKIYQPVFAPVVNDINKYIYQPLAEKTSEVWDKYGEWVHNSLDIAGFIPGFGDIADGLNGLIYLAEGRYIEASVSALSMIPIVGDIVGKGGKVAVKVGAAVAGAAAVKIAKEAVEEAIEKGVKEVVEEGLEKGLKEVGEEALEKAAKELGEEAGEKVTKEIAEETGEKIAREAAEETTEKIAKEVADKTAKEVTTEAEKGGVALLMQRVSDGINLVRDHGPMAIKAILASGVANANKLFRTLDKNTLDYAIRQGSDAIDALARWKEKDLIKYGPELALRAEKDGKVLAAAKKLVSLGPLDPKKLTKEQDALIKVMAENSTQYSDAGRVVLGKWVDQSSGFVEIARNTGSTYYNPHPGMWKTFEGLGKQGQEDAAWLVNRQVIRTGAEKGLPFEYTLNGIKLKDVKLDVKAIETIWKGPKNTDAIYQNIKKTLNVENVSFRIRELVELYNAGYTCTFDVATKSYSLVKP